jgi:hypothetical protein
VPYGVILNIGILVAFILAFIKAELIQTKIIFATIMAVIVLLPQVVSMSPTTWIWWVHYIAKVLFGLACVIYVMWEGMAY